MARGGGEGNATRSSSVTPQLASHASNGLPLYSKPELRSRSCRHEPTPPTSI
jgi:hypothetical protein